MDFLTFSEIISIFLFLVPGYIIIYVISLITDYIYEKNQLDRVIQYLMFSFIAYLSTFIILGLLSIPIQSLRVCINPSSLNMLIITSLAIVISPLLGFVMGNFYFGRGYPHKYFSKFTNKKYAQSIYGECFLKEFRNGAWVTCHMKDGTILQGRLLDYDKDEDTRDYVISLIDVKQYHPEARLYGDKIVLNIKETLFIEFKK